MTREELCGKICTAKERSTEKTGIEKISKKLKKVFKKVLTNLNDCDIICESPQESANGSIAQLGEHLPYKQRVIGSSPIVPTIRGPVVQLVRTLACHARGQGFESPSGRHFYIIQPLLYASVAQLVEQGTENPRVVGSIPTGGTTYADLAHLVERRLAKAKVAGSSPVIRSKETGTYKRTRYLS